MGVNRRSFIRYGSLAAAGSAAGLRPFGALNSLAQGATGYKALVCVFLFGGNDGNNTVIPISTPGSNPANSYDVYAKVRAGLALPQGRRSQGIEGNEQDSRGSSHFADWSMLGSPCAAVNGWPCRATIW